MDLRLQPKPEVDYLPADRGIVSRKQFFVKKKFEKINQYFSAGHLIRKWKPKAELIYPPQNNETETSYEYDFNREVQNCFVEDNAEEVFLRNPPPCFVVFGKFKREMNNFAKTLAHEYGSLLIQIEEVVSLALDLKNETSKTLERILRLGFSLTLNFILALMSLLAHSTVGRHRGYVLTGLPCIPISYDLSPEQQFNYLLTWENKPTFFIHALFEDEDLAQERLDLRMRVEKQRNDSFFRFSKVLPIPKEESESEDDENSPMDVEKFSGREPDINISPSTPCVHLPRYEESRIWEELEQYDSIIKPVIQSIISRIDPQYFITVDSRIGNQYEIVLKRLNLLQIWKAPSAKPFFDFADDTSEDAELSQIREEPPETAFLKLFTKNAISPKFRWELSHYNYICPVSLREGKILEGKTEFAVSFMKYIYFMRDHKSMLKFIENPRAFVLPIRPKPLCRFIILGYPFTGKTTLAVTLSQEYSIPVIDFKKVLDDDLNRKKNTYLEFCRQKAECREITRLTNLAWEEWRREEEKRIDLIEEWILYIQNLLTRRIEEFYSGGTETREVDEMSESLMPEGGMEFQEEGLTEANFILSSIWNYFSEEEQHMRQVEEYEEYGEFSEKDDESVNITVNWCSLLPPQSLSSFLMSKKPYTVREKRQSFKIFLNAASKIYWKTSELKSEFVKWRLPCFMDIPLCEVFLDNPLMLLRYLPTWLKERPLIPDPIDATHPEVVRATSEAYRRASVVRIQQSEEEIGILLHHAIEKAEREGMRVTGEILTPGGWVLDNMSLDLKIWEKLACEGVLADHIYILIDTEPNYQRIINLWWEICGSLENTTDKEEEEEEEEEDEKKEMLELKKKSSERFNSIIQMLTEVVDDIAEGEYQLDVIYDEIVSEVEANPEKYYSLYSSIKYAFEVKSHIACDILSIQSVFDTLSYTPSTTRFNKTLNTFLGADLEVVTSKILDYFNGKRKEDDVKDMSGGCQDDDIKFFINLLTLPKKLEELKNWLIAIDRSATVEEIEMTGKTPEEVFLEIKNVLMTPFIKKPRELEEFEIHEILESQNELGEDLSMSSAQTLQDDDVEDVRIFGESGQLCVVNLERDIYLLGKVDFSLRYYGKLYYFWNQDAKNKFIEDPEKYAPYYSAIRCYPPLRIFVMGPAGSGKTEISTSLSHQCGIPHVDYPKFLVNSLLPHTNLTSLTGEENFKMLLSEDHNQAAKSALQVFLNSSYLTRQFWLDNSSAVVNFTKGFILKKIESLKTPVVFQEYPELNYSCGDSLLSETRDNQSENLTKSDIPEIPYTSLKEVETMLQNYINNSGELTEYCVDRSLKTLWTTEPYISKGFVLDNFPMRLYDVKHVIENNWIPDLVIELVVPEDVVVDRNINNLMTTWEQKLIRQTREEMLLEDTVANIQRISTFFRREELMEEFQPENKLNVDLTESIQTIGDSIGEVEQETEITGYSKNGVYDSQEKNDRVETEIDMILTKEMPKLVFNPIFETYDDGKVRLIQNLTKNYKRDVAEIEKLKSEFSGVDVPWIEIDGTKKLNELLPELHLMLDKIRKRIKHKGEFAFPMRHKTADALLEQGYYFLSKFGKWCPVQVYRMKNPINMYYPFVKRKKITPIAYRNYIYYVAGENEKQKFLEDPIKYTFNEPQHPNIPLRVAVIGPPKCGKTTLSTRLGLMFDLKVITMGSALRFTLEKAPTSALSRSLKGYLNRGCFPPLSLKVEALLLCLNDPSCATQGFVFDGIPFDAALTQSLAEKGKLPFVIISLVGDSYFGKINREGLHLEEFRLPYKNRVNMDKRYSDWNDTYKRFSQWNQTTYNNLYEVNAKLSVVDIFYKAYDIIRKAFFGILYYVQYCTTDRVLPLQYLCVSPHEYNLRKSPIKNNCPVCWLEKGILSNSTDPPPPSGLVQYKNNFFWICPQHMDEFVKNPKKYYYPQTPQWPELMAKRCGVNCKKTNIHGYGRCPVTRVDFPKSLDWEGSLSFAAEYAGEVFLCKNEQMLSRFLSQPWKYSKADTKFEYNRHNKSKAVENLGPPLLTSLPPIGFLEQTVADLIHECLQVLGTVRPVYPNISPTATGCIFMGLYLKAHNKRNKSSRLEREYLNFMLKSCPAFTFMVKERGLPERNLTEDYPVFAHLEDFEHQESKESIRTIGRSTKGTRDWMDIPIRVDRNVWVAPEVSPKKTPMRLIDDDTLVEIPERPKHCICLKLELSDLRANPFPPLSNCLTVLYSPKKNLDLPKKFNYNCLYQPFLEEPPERTKKILFNTNRQFSIMLHEKTQMKEFPSKVNLQKRTYSDDSVETGVQMTMSNIDATYMKEHFIPRFQMLDRLKNVNPPALPKVHPEEYITFSPLENYSYALLISDFFGMNHYLRQFNFGMNQEYYEYWNKLSDNLGLTTAEIDFEFQPKQTGSMRSRTSLDDYQDVFDAATSFAIGSRFSDLSVESKPNSRTSTYNFMMSLLEERLEDLFSQFSFKNFDFDVSTTSLPKSQKLVITESFPSPPMPWDIESRPYHSYKSLTAILTKVHLHQVIHPRRLSMLDGVVGSAKIESKFKLLDVSAGQEEMEPCGTVNFPGKQRYFYYDFFNLPWTSYLVYSLETLRRNHESENSYLDNLVKNT